jgi:hypothetical protein
LRERTIGDIPFESGGIGGTGYGRTDRVPLEVGSNSHVVPSYTVAALGQGHTPPGIITLGQVLKTGPYGVALPSEFKGKGAPAPPHFGGIGSGGGGGGTTRTTFSGGLGGGFGGGGGGGSSEFAAAGGEHGHKTSILAASGEYVVSPEVVYATGVRAIRQGLAKTGEPPMEAGHRLIDEMIERVRKAEIDWLKHAPPPKKKHGGPVLDLHRSEWKEAA